MFRMSSLNTERNNTLEKFHIKTLHINRSLVDCIYYTVYCQLRYSVMMLKHLLSILNL